MLPWSDRGWAEDLSGLEPLGRDALDELFSVSYGELRRLAASVKRSDGSITINPTALVNEAWLKLSRSPQFVAVSHLHFTRIAARAMRQVLIEAARRRQSVKRGGSEALMVALDEASGQQVTADEEMLALDAALDALAQIHPRQAAMVEMRFFGGLQEREIATLLGISEATVLRDWRAARAFLSLELRQR